MKDRVSLLIPDDALPFNKETSDCRIEVKFIRAPSWEHDYKAHELMVHPGYLSIFEGSNKSRSLLALHYHYYAVVTCKHLGKIEHNFLYGLHSITPERVTRDLMTPKLRQHLDSDS
ncbi:hypothetical protein [Vibrio taketomensis]|nr:hypothetical protein [Vibrio taketomensis]